MSTLISKKNSCCFSGYRPEKLPWGLNETDGRCIALKKRIFDAVMSVYETGITHFICGMARGSDTYFCELVLTLRDTYPKITIEAALPCEEQASKWNEDDRNRYFNLIAKCDFETMVSNKYSRDCMLKRNMYMVENSSVIIAVFDGRLGGTMHTLGYATRCGLKRIELTPV